MKRKAELEDFFTGGDADSKVEEPLRRPKPQPQITTEEVVQETSAVRKQRDAESLDLSSDDSKSY